MMVRHRPLVAILLAIFLGVTPGYAVARAAEKPAVVLTAFGTSTAAADTYRHVETQVRKRFPSLTVRWAYTSQQVRRKVLKERGEELKDLPQVLQELRAAGFSRVAVQSLHVVPGEEWDEMVRESRQVAGLRVALGQPLLSSDRDQALVLAALQKSFPADLRKNAVVLVGHGSPSPRGESAYLAFEKLLRSRYPGQNVFLGTVQNQPAGETALAAVKDSGAERVVFIPLLLVAGEHINKDILGNEPDSWKNRLLTQRPLQVDGLRQGLGYRDDIVAIYLDHLDEALKTLNP